MPQMVGKKNVAHPTKTTNHKPLKSCPITAAPTPKRRVIFLRSWLSAANRYCAMKLCGWLWLIPRLSLLSLYSSVYDTPSFRHGSPESRAQGCEQLILLNNSHGDTCRLFRYRRPWLLDSLTRSDGSGNPCRNDVLPDACV
jgi:hypothetical protein